MKKFIRIIALVMALLTMSGLFAACANTQTAEETTDGAGVAETEAPVVETTAEETLYAPDDLKEKLKQVNSDFKLWDTYRETDRLAVTSGGNVLMVTDSSNEIMSLFLRL